MGVTDQIYFKIIAPGVAFACNVRPLPIAVAVSAKAVQLFNNS